MTTALAASPRPRYSTTYLRLEVRRLLRNRRTVVFTVVMPVVFFLIFGANLPQPEAKAYVMISLAVYGAMVAATSAGAAVAVERASGWSRQLRLTPMRPASYVVTKLATAVVLALLPVAVEFVLGAAMGARMGAGDWLVAGAVAWLGSLVFAAFGLAMGYLLPSENTMQVLGPVLAVLAMLGGLFVPLSVLGATMRHVAEFTPAYGVGVLARHPLGGDGSVLGAAVNVATWTVLFAVGAALLFRRDTARV
jgi:ABC-2 type transport system permease protein